MKYVNKNGLLTIVSFSGLCAALLLVPGAALPQESGRKKSAIKPDDKIQAAIGEMVKLKEFGFERERVQAWQELDGIARGKPEVLAEQMIYFVSNAKKDTESWGGIGVMKLICLTFSSKFDKRKRGQVSFPLIS